jgi:hypothetical protein
MPMRDCASSHSVKRPSSSPGPAALSGFVAQVDEAVLAAAQAERGMVELHVVEADASQHEVPPGNRDFRAVERERGLAATVVHLESVQRHEGPQPFPSAADALRGDRHARGARDGRDDVVAVPVDVRQAPIAQPEHRQGEDYEEEGRGAGRQAQENSRNSLHLALYCSLWMMGFERTCRLSRYVSRVANARPAVVEDLERRNAAPFTREEMREALAGEPEGLSRRFARCASA